MYTRSSAVTPDPTSLQLLYFFARRELLPSRGFTRPRTQRLQQFLLHGCDLREVPSGDPHLVGGPRARPLLPPHRSLATPKGCPDPAASALPGALRHAASPPLQSVVKRYSARARRAVHHDPDRVPVLVAPASLVSPFVGWPSRCSSCLRWLHITDFDRQISLDTAISAQILARGGREAFVRLAQEP